MPRIVLCRHGETESNAAGHFLSHADPPLSPRGRAQCAALRDALAEYRLERCLVSPMLRCLETLRIAAPAIPFEIDDALREVHFGEWEGKTLEWLERNDPDGLAERRREPVAFRPPGGESFTDVEPRLRELAERIGGERLLVIGHRGTLGVLERVLRGVPLDSPLVAPLETAELRLLD